MVASLFWLALGGVCHFHTLWQSRKHWSRQDNNGEIMSLMKSLLPFYRWHLTYLLSNHHFQLLPQLTSPPFSDVSPRISWTHLTSPWLLQYLRVGFGQGASIYAAGLFLLGVEWFLSICWFGVLALFLIHFHAFTTLFHACITLNKAKQKNKNSFLELEIN